MDVSARNDKFGRDGEAGRVQGCRIGVLALSFVMVAAVAAAAEDCPDLGREPVAVTEVASRGELRLADNRTVRLVGFDSAQDTPDRPDLGEATRAALAARLVGRPVSLHVMASKPDRWGRLAAFAWAGDAHFAGGVVAEMLAAGAGRYLPEPLAHLCRAEFVRAETTARDAKLGLWADPYYGVLAVDDRASFVERVGTIVLFEGTVAEIQSSSFRTTLRFVAPGQASRGVHMLVVTILPRVMKTFRAQQMEVSQLVGRRVRFRGLLDMRFGPRIELNGPDEVEILDTADAKPPPN